MIQLFHVSKYYQKDVPALYEMNIHVPKGDFVFITGPSGAGKSTLLKLIFAEERPTKGQILVHGRNIARLPNSKIPTLRREIGVVFQDFKLLPNRNVFENVSLALEVLGIPRRETSRRVWLILKRLGVHHKMRANPLTLSGGEQQRVAIARALVNEPLILIADEPTGSLDNEASRHIMEIFSDVNARGTTVIVATHDIDMVNNMSRDVIHLENGSVARGGIP
ncbi:MAG TPA: cell division ATP-binding protein FtsE [Proteobacteria bacterium]|nr:cell division ATP-binding protein FtsE [bacterium BMS3Abin14]HDL53388.1 cell division ATP-binding protein FtsE [Pseudomonadota bacterium]